MSDASCEPRIAQIETTVAHTASAYRAVGVEVNRVRSLCNFRQHLAKEALDSLNSRIDSIEDMLLRLEYNMSFFQKTFDRWAHNTDPAKCSPDAYRLNIAADELRNLLGTELGAHDGTS